MAFEFLFLLGLVGEGSRWIGNKGWLPPKESGMPFKSRGKVGYLDADGKPALDEGGKPLSAKQKAAIMKREEEMKAKEMGAKSAGVTASFDSVKFDEPGANKKVGEMYNAAREEVNNRYGKLSFRNPEDREAISKRKKELSDIEERYSSWLKDYGRATSSEWNPSKPTAAEEKRMQQKMDLFKSEQMYESQLRRGEYQPKGKKGKSKK